MCVCHKYNTWTIKIKAIEQNEDTIHGVHDHIDVKIQ